MKKFLLTMLVATATLISAQPSDWDGFKNQTLQTQARLPGWCSKEKAEKLMEMVASEQPAVWVEVGVFGGSSVYPVAQALKYFNCGVIHAIDPWTGEACAAGYDDDNDPNVVWWTALNLQQIYDQFCNLIRRANLRKHCVILRKTSAEAVLQFENDSVDVLHIDGNHSELQSMFDVTNWLPKVKSGGYIWLDDTNWATTQKAVDFLYTHCEIDENLSIGDSCLCFRKP